MRLMTANDEQVCSSLAGDQCLGVTHSCKGDSSFVLYTFNEAETENTFYSFTFQSKCQSCLKCLSFMLSGWHSLWFCTGIFLIKTKKWCQSWCLSRQEHIVCSITSYQVLLFCTWNSINSSHLETLLLSQGGLIIINSMERTRLAPLPSCMHLLADCIDTLMLRWGDWCEVRVVLSIFSAALRLRDCWRLNGPQALFRCCCLVSFKPVLAGHHVVRGHLDNHSIKRSCFVFLQEADGRDSNLGM